MTLSISNSAKPSAVAKSSFSRNRNKNAMSGTGTGSVAGGASTAPSTSNCNGIPPRTATTAAILACSSSSRPSFAAGRAQQARETAFKQIHHNISVLSSRRLQLQRVMASCFREANTVASIAERAKDHRRRTMDALERNRERIVRLSLVASAVVAAGTRSPSSSQQQYRHRDPSSSSCGGGEGSDEKPPFSLLYRRRQSSSSTKSEHHKLVVASSLPVSDDQGRSLGPSATPVPTLCTTHEVLSHRESATIFEHMALLESLGERIDRGASEAMAIHQELVHARVKGQHMLNLLDRAIDAEVQVLHGAFPDGSPAPHAGAATRSRSSGPQNDCSTHANDAAVVFVNASPLFPNLTVSDFPDVLASMSALTIKSSETLKDLRRCMDEGSYRVSESTSELHRHLERGVRIAHTKHAEAVLFHAAAVNEEKKHLAKRSGLLAELQQLQQREEDIERTLTLRAALGVSSLSPARRHHQQQQRLVADACSARRSRSKSPNRDGEAVPIGDAVTSTLMEERTQLQTQLNEVVQKIAKLDVILKRVSLEKHYHHQDVDASAMRSVTCAALSPSRSRSGAAAA